MTKTSRLNRLRLTWVCIFLLSFGAVVFGQATKTAVERGSQTAKNGFKNETEIAEKFNNWKTDSDARDWLRTMGYPAERVENVTATKPHGEKSDVLVKIKTAEGEFNEGISIKLVSSENGFNQIDKRWLSHYVRMWKMPDDVRDSMKLFLGEVPPNGRSRRPERMYFNEMDESSREAVLRFFTDNRDQIVSDLFEGDGIHKANWLLVAQKRDESQRWVLRRINEAAAFFADGKVEFTRQGNLKIGKITIQRKGGDGGRESAKMLQFKINPALLFTAK